MVFDWLNVDVTSGDEGVIEISLSVTDSNFDVDRSKQLRFVMPDNATSQTLTVTQAGTNLTIIAYGDDDTIVSYGDDDTIVGY